MTSVPGQFPEAERAALYRIIALRRDIREFRPEQVPEATLHRILRAAEHAPSVGFSQPWAFIIIEDRDKRAHIRESFLHCRQGEAARYPEQRRAQYLSYKLEGILEAPLNLCVVADLRPRQEAILGTTAQPAAVRASVCCAIQNLWLAARAEGVGVGWVSIVEPQVLRQTLGLPSGVEPIAYLCVGYPKEFRARPLLEETKWLERKRFEDLIHRERWQVEDTHPIATCASNRTVETVRRSDVSSRTPAKLAKIPAFSRSALEQALAHQASLTKPIGSLAKLEQLAAWYAGAHGRFPAPLPDPIVHAVFAADHGVVVEGVSAYGSQVTAAMVCNVMAGGAAINVLAERFGIPIVLVDVGVAGDTFSVPARASVELVRAKVRSGTRNLCRERAMSEDEALRALEVGEATARQAIARGAKLLTVGELGIGNTTSAAALICAFSGAEPRDIVGRGTGIDEQTWLRKVSVVERALALHAPNPNAPLQTLAALGGLELAAMTGYLLAAARGSVPVVLDGYLTNAAALVARALDPRVTDYLLAAHVSAEKGARRALEILGLTPVFDLGLRLGEGTGAVLAADLVRSAVLLQASMATFATLGVERGGS